MAPLGHVVPKRKLDLQQPSNCSNDLQIEHAEGLGFRAVRRRCAQIENRCFSGSEVMDLERESGRNGAVLLCGFVGDDVAGYALLQRAAPRATISKLAVDPRYRRRGIGRRLMDSAVQIAQASGIEECLLHVDETNEAAKQLYTAIGFRVLRRLEHYYCERGVGTRRRESCDCDRGLGCRHANEMQLILQPVRTDPIEQSRLREL